MISLLISLSVAAEGMWLPEQVEAIAPAWKDKGLELDAATLGDPLGWPLGAIVSTGGCSASFVSPNGLIATNHHCVEGYLQYLSTPDQNRHRDGFVAATQAEEASAGPTAKLRVVESVTDVTGSMLKGITTRTADASRAQRLEDNSKALVATCERAVDRRCFVVPYFGGSTWRLVRTFEIEDVRVVFAPPMSLGQFGGEIDNWMWPRHSADFSFLRAYVAPNGEAAPYAVENVPYKPPHHLRISTEGVEEGDFVMIAGFPGRTARHLLAAELAWEAEQRLPRTIRLGKASLEILERHAATSTEAAGKVGARISGISNRVKKSEGVLDGVLTWDVLHSVADHERRVLAALTAAPALAGATTTHAALLAAVEEGQAEATRLDPVRDLFVASLLGTAHDAVRWATEKPKADKARDPGFQDRDHDRRVASFDRLDRSLWLPAERDLFAAALARYEAAPEAHRVPAVDAWLAARGGAAGALAVLFDAPALADAKARRALLDLPLSSLQSSTDPWVQLAVAMEGFLGPYREASKAREGRDQRLRAAWMGARRALGEPSGLPMYDDANGTLRLTFGQVMGYHPADGLLATPFTTLAGLRAKVGAEPFDAPPEVVARIGAPSRWTSPTLGDVPVDFLCDLDITGGNSGSAVLDGAGKLVGLAFDGVWESVASDWTYLDAVNRTIVVDARYMLWVLDGDTRTHRLVEELGVPRP